MKKLLEILKHWATARDGVSWSLTKLFATSAVATMVYKFIIDISPDYIGFSGGVAAIISALAAKYYIEDAEK